MLVLILILLILAYTGFLVYQVVFENRSLFNLKTWNPLAYEKGVPMGGELDAGKAPVQLLIHATKDPMSEDLERVQVIKGWVDASGKSHEKIYDAARAKVTRESVNLDTARTDHAGGKAQFAILWTDPDYDASHNAFYYVRVLEMPKVRHTHLDALALKEDPSVTQHDSTIRERAFSSPIWVNAN